VKTFPESTTALESCGDETQTLFLTHDFTGNDFQLLNEKKLRLLGTPAARYYFINRKVKYYLPYFNSPFQVLFFLNLTASSNALFAWKDHPQLCYEGPVAHSYWSHEGTQKGSCMLFFDTHDTPFP
jgi:hypothetical protein